MTESTAFSLTDVVELNPTYLFRWEEPQQAHVLLYPEGVVKLNETAAAILELCDGHRTVESIVSDLNDRYSTDVTDSVNKFLGVSHAKGWLRVKS